MGKPPSISVIPDFSRDLVGRTKKLAFEMGLGCARDCLRAVDLLVLAPVRSLWYSSDKAWRLR